MTVTDTKTLALELMSAYSSGQSIMVPPSARETGFDLPAAYAVEGELARMRRASGHATVGRKVGFASKALWRTLKLDTLAWAHMYDDTVQYAENNEIIIPIGHLYSPKIEPEIVFKLKKPISGDSSDPAAVLEAVEWLALGFEIVDCRFPDWKFTPPDFVAAFGLHAALVVGEPRQVRPEMIAELVDRLPAFTVRLRKNHTLVEEGSGKNSLRSPALCLGELASAISRQTGAEALTAGELVSSGSLTAAHPLAAGDTWTAIVDGLSLPALTLCVPRIQP
jgi:2-keto-4-pentenoate hydratase